jgi:hypothetical protein
MLPLIRDGDRAIVAHGCTGVRRGDVVVFRHDGLLVAHRLLAIRRGDAGPVFISKGDNTSQFDPPLLADEILGRVVAIERHGRSMALDTAVWRALGWLIAITTLAWTRLYGWGRGLKRRLGGRRPGRATAGVRQGARAASALALRASQAIASRWKEKRTSRGG